VYKQYVPETVRTQVTSAPPDKSAPTYYKYQQETVVGLKSDGTMAHVGCTDTSDPRHFGPKTLRHHRDGSEMSGQFGISTEVSIRHFGTRAELSAVRRLFNV